MQAIVWTIAGSDSSAGAGIQADQLTFKNLGVHGGTVITAITAQNSQGIDSIYYLPPSQVKAQMDALHHDLPAKAIKLGMLGDVEIIKVINDFLAEYSGYVILDPVITASTGCRLFNLDLQEYLSHLTQLFPRIDCLTPNLREAEFLVGYALQSKEDITRAAQDILSQGVKSVLIKGGHAVSDKFSQDYWTNGKESFWLIQERYLDAHYHGTGCTLSAAITAGLALNYDIKDALVLAKMYISQSIKLAKPLQNERTLYLEHAHWPEQPEYLPYLSHQPFTALPEKFKDCGEAPLGLYPVVDNAAWLEKLLPLGVNTIQLRIKDKVGMELENEIKKAIMIAHQYQARLFINDYWELAIQLGAYGVHLGQEDIATAKIEEIRHAGLRLGISTHCYYEVARAHALSPSYIACGPIYETTSKNMSFAPQGLEQLRRWRKTLAYPLVAIGGIHLERISDVIATGVESVAMISAITQAKNPEEMTRKLMQKIITALKC